MYAVFGCTSFVSAPAIKFLGDKCSLILGTCGYLVYISAQMLAVVRAENPDFKPL